MYSTKLQWQQPIGRTTRASQCGFNSSSFCLTSPPVTSRQSVAPVEEVASNRSAERPQSFQVTFTKTIETSTFCLTTLEIDLAPCPAVTSSTSLISSSRLNLIVLALTRSSSRVQLEPSLFIQTHSPATRPYDCHCHPTNPSRLPQLVKHAINSTMTPRVHRQQSYSSAHNTRIQRDEPTRKATCIR